MAVKITDNTGSPRLVPDTKETNARIRSVAIAQDAVITQPINTSSTSGKKVLLTGLWPRKTGLDKVTITQYAVNVEDRADKKPEPFKDDIVLETVEGIKISTTESGGVASRIEISGEDLMKKADFPDEIVTGVVFSEGDPNEVKVTVSVSEKQADGTFDDRDEEFIFSANDENISVVFDGGVGGPKMILDTTQDLEDLIRKDSISSGTVLSGIDHKFTANQFTMTFKTSDVDDGSDDEIEFTLKGTGGLRILGSGNGIEIDGTDAIAQATASVSGLINTLTNTVNGYQATVTGLTDEITRVANIIIPGMTGRIVALEGINAGTRLTSLETIVGNLGTGLANLNSELGNTNSALGSVSTNLASLNGTVSSWSSMYFEPNGLIDKWTKVFFRQAPEPGFPGVGALTYLFGREGLFEENGSVAGRLNNLTTAVEILTDLVGEALAELARRNTWGGGPSPVNATLPATVTGKQTSLASTLVDLTEKL